MSTEGNNQKENDRIESLRLILERDKQQVLTYDETVEIGENLISFFEVLAEDVPDASEDLGGVSYGSAR